MRTSRAVLAGMAVLAACSGDPAAGTDAAPERPAGVAATWVHHAPDDGDVEWWAPPGFMAGADTTGVAPCDSTTPGADAAVAALADSSDDASGLPLTVVLRRGPLTGIVDANHFRITDDGEFTSDGRGGGSTIVNKGATWLALAGELWVAHDHPGANAPAQAPTNVLFGAADAGQGCYLVFVERGDGTSDVDTLAAVLRTVRTRPE